jgi:hypothetical protein
MTRLHRSVVRLEQLLLGQKARECVVVQYDVELVPEDPTGFDKWAAGVAGPGVTMVIAIPWNHRDDLKAGGPQPRPAGSWSPGGK